jgi:hypothetical protein
MLKFILMILLLPSVSLATFIVPDVARNQREIHTSAAASGWSTRKVMGFNYLRLTEEEETTSIKTEEIETDYITPFVFFRTDFGLTVEFEYDDEAEETEEFNPSAAKDKNDTTSLDFNFGYQLPTLPMTVGFSYETSDLDEKDGSTGDKDQTDTKTYELGFSYKLNEQFYIGAGVEQEHEEDKPEGGPNDKDKDEQFYVGAGFIKGTEDKPEMIGEAVLVLSNEEGQKIQTLVGDALLNHGNIEFSGNVAFGRYDGTIDGTVRIISAGMDYQTGVFYIAPSLLVSASDIERDSSNVEQTITNSVLVFEGGYRADALTAYALVQITGGELDQDRPTNVTQDFEGDGIGFGVSYKF